MMEEALDFPFWDRKLFLIGSQFLHNVEYVIGKNPQRGVRLYHAPKLLSHNF